MRISKIGSEGTTTYTVEGTTILAEKRILDSVETLISYHYGSDGIFGFTYNGTDYYYGKNLFGDITDIYDASGVKVAHYAYDAWGNHTVYNGSGTPMYSLDFIGVINPFRYRGYYYDIESGRYYLQSRYYDPTKGRFLNADTLPYLGADGELRGYNLYTYCGNNPVGATYSNSFTSTPSLTIVGKSRNAFLPAIPNWMKHISKANDVFSSAAHSAIVGNYLFQSFKSLKDVKYLPFIDDMNLLGVNPAKALHALPKASWLNKISYLFAGIDAIVTLYDNLQQGNSWEQALLDCGLSFLKGIASAWVGGFVGANIGGAIGLVLGSLIPIPGLGTFIGFVAGTALGVLVSWCVDHVLSTLKDALLDLIFD